MPKPGLYDAPRYSPFLKVKFDVWLIRLSGFLACEVRNKIKAGFSRGERTQGSLDFVRNGAYIDLTGE
jgi:hypothetical protein